MQRLEVSGAVRHIYASLGFKGLIIQTVRRSYQSTQNLKLQQTKKQHIQNLARYFEFCTNTDT